MKLLRLSIAILILRGACFIAGALAGHALSPEHPLRTPRPTMQRMERMLLAAIVGLAICAMWFWISGRAG